ncbi:hypothetical protein MHYP_G00123960 [Metynnis hypsauchen]
MTHLLAPTLPLPLLAAFGWETAVMMVQRRVGGSFKASCLLIDAAASALKPSCHGLGLYVEEVKERLFVQSYVENINLSGDFEDGKAKEPAHLEDTKLDNNGYLRIGL